MPRGVKKENLPFKICVTCGRPFNWRKKWERCWDEVTTCSNSCNRQRRLAKSSSSDVRFSTADLPRRPFSTSARAANDSEGESSGDDTDTDDVAPVANPNATADSPPIDKPTQPALEDTKGSNSKGSKRCDKCRTFVDQLIRCRIDASRQWCMICDDCWPSVSGGVTDGDDAHPYYQYGGLWKNRRKV